MSLSSVTPRPIQDVALGLGDGEAGLWAMCESSTAASKSHATGWRSWTWRRRGSRDRSWGVTMGLEEVIEAMTRKIKVKSGMAGSSAGRGRGEKTGDLKDFSKKARRRQASARVGEGLRERP